MSDNAVREKHLGALAEVVKNYIDEELANVSGGSAANVQVFSGATNLTGGASGLVPAPQAGDQDKVLSANGSWVTLPTASTTQKGGIKVGTGLAMNGDTLNCTITGGSTGSSTAIVLSNSSSTVDGAIWIDTDIASLDGTSAIILPTLPPSPLVNGSMWLVITDD